jgi:glycosyltransferase involved in cell wall biosynthesis
MEIRMRISVVIPTYNSSPVIERVLTAIFSGSRLPDEVIVVDGYSKDGTIQKALSFPVSAVMNPKVHAAAARNLGIENSHGDVIAFTDSDCVPRQDWLERIECHFNGQPDIAGLGGRMLALPPRNDIEAFSGQVFLNEIMCFPPVPQFIRSRRLIGAFITANCAYRKDILLSGGFRDEFGNHAEDIDLFWRLLGKVKLFYDPDLIVHHSFPSTRRSLARKYFQHGIASSKLTRYHLGGPRVDKMLHRKLVRSIGQVLSFKKTNRWAGLYCIQLSSHILGKVYGSVLMRTVNL